MMFERWSFLSPDTRWLCLLACSACADATVGPTQHVDAAAEQGPSASTDSRDGGLRPGTDAHGNAADAATSQRSLAACAAVGGDAPRTIADVVARINALPEPLRRHIRDLEIRCDSTGHIQIIASQKKQIDELLRRIAELEAEVKAIQDGYLKSF